MDLTRFHNRTINDIRAELGLPPVPGGDNHVFVPNETPGGTIRSATARPEGPQAVPATSDPATGLRNRGARCDRGPQ